MSRNPLLLLTVAVALVGCDSSTEDIPSGHDCPDCASLAAKIAYDTNTGGVYKGIIVGRESSGRFQLNAKNGDDVLSMTVEWQRDGKPPIADTLVPQGLASWEPGQNLSNITFLGAQMRTTVFIENAGETSSVGDFVISGNTGPNPQATMMKETSTAQVKVYQGSFTGSSSFGSGVVNALVQESRIQLILEGNGGFRERIDETLDANGNFSRLFSTFIDPITVSGQVGTGDTITGTISTASSALATFEITRTM